MIERIKPGLYFKSYIGSIFIDPDAFLKKAKEILSPNLSKFDCLVGTGLSGTIFTTLLARELNKNFLIIRKQNESCHSSEKIEGILREKYLFVDDFVETGSTFIEVLSKINKASRENKFKTKCVGAYLYQYSLSLNNQSNFNKMGFDSYCSGYFTFNEIKKSKPKWIETIEKNNI